MIIAKSHEDMDVGGKRVAINFAINYEEGTERSPLLGDAARDSRTRVRMYCQRVTETFRKR